MKIVSSIILLLTMGFALNCGTEEDFKWVLGVAALASTETSSASTGANSGTGDSTDSSDDSTSTTVATPSFSPTAGTQTSNANISISTTTDGATIYYTTDGTDPTTSSTQYSAPIANIWSLAGKTIKAIAVKEGLTNSTILTGVFSLPPLKTGQTTVHEAGDNGTNQSGINRSYTDNGDGTVTDNATGLVWQKCSKGRNNDGTCSDDTGVTDTSNWTDAGTYCSGLSLAGKTWRLPSRQELETMPDYSKSNPAIDATAFPATVNSSYWSSTTYAPTPTNDAWYVSLTDGEVKSAVQTNTNSVRCVSGSSKEIGSSFTDNSDGTVKDKATGLIWQKCSIGQNNDGTCSGTATTPDWSTAISDCSGLSLAGRTWRLPTINELKTIVDTTKATGANIDTDVFPATVASNYWSSTTSSTNSTVKWVVRFNIGYLDSYSNSSSFYVRCVSGP